MHGKIIKGIAGFYYVHVPDGGIYECKAKGIFRRDNRKPLVGDNVELDCLNDRDFLGNIVKLLPRGNELLRPAVANIDQAVIIFSIVKPAPNYTLLDRFLVTMEKQGIPCLLLFNKEDIASEEERAGILRDYGCYAGNILFTSAVSGVGIEEFRKALHEKTTAVAGPSGVGKSSLINCIQKDIYMEIGDISRKIDRGKHTTRHSQLIMVDESTYIMDTPGFSSLELENVEKEKLSDFYPEFRDHINKCRFQGCSHIHEPVCGVKEALSEGRISLLRYRNYVTLYTELCSRKKY